MKTLKCCQPRQSVLDGSEHFVVNLTALSEVADAYRAVQHLVDCPNFWPDRQSHQPFLLSYLHQTTEAIEAWSNLLFTFQTLRLAVEAHRA
jgi:hypothetical protein